MANNKTGFKYYNVDTDRYLDPKIKRLTNNFGCAGMSVYDYILCNIYRVNGCFIKWDENTAYDVADHFGLKENLVREIVNYCCAVGLFDKELLTSGNILSSNSIQRRYIEICMSLKRKDISIPDICKIAELSRGTPNNPEYSGVPPDYSPRQKGQKRQKRPTSQKEPVTGGSSKISVLTAENAVNTGFDEWWNCYKPCLDAIRNVGGFKHSCEIEWLALTDAEREKARKHTAEYVLSHTDFVNGKRSALFYLRDKIFETPINTGSNRGSNEQKQQVRYSQPLVDIDAILAEDAILDAEAAALRVAK
jgi:hypothetical protein